MFKSIFKAVAMSAVAAFFCVGCSEKDDGGGEEPGGEGGGTKTSYTITFNANGGTVSPTSAKTGDDGKLVSLPTPTRTGYTFDGWYTAQTGGTKVSESTVYRADATIYARWTEPLTPPDTANPNDTTGGGTDTTSSGTDTTGGGTKSSHTVTFDPNGGTVSPTSDTTGADGKLDSLPTPTRNGYDFDGWYTAAAGGTAVSAGNVYSANTTIYAQWTAVVVNPAGLYTITFDANGGTVNPTSVKTDAEGVLLIPLPTPTRDDYAFSGWYTSKTGGTKVADNNNKVFSQNTTFYAQWRALSLGTITFNANGGTVSPTSGKTDSVGMLLVPLPAPTRNAYTFDGWYTSTTGGTKIAESSVFKGDTTVYARWTPTRIATPTKTTFEDSRDGKTYNKVLIGDQIWMAENLNYSTTGSKCYDDALEGCAKYGRLYNWTTAMGGKSSSSKSPSGVQGVCPAGWHLPSDGEWSTLINYVDSSTSGKKLKSTSGWNSSDAGVSGNGTDEYGFSALPGGYGSSGGSFYFAGYYGNWWSATEYDAGSAWFRYMLYSNEDVGRNYHDESILYSVRCLQD